MGGDGDCSIGVQGQVLGPLSQALGERQEGFLGTSKAIERVNPGQEGSVGSRGNTQQLGSGGRQELEPTHKYA